MRWFWRSPERSRRIRELEEDLEKFRSEMKRLRLEWEDTYDRLKHMMGRIAKRSAIIEAQTDSTEPEEPATSHAVNGPPGSPWSAHQHKLQEQILANRRRGIPNA